MSQARPRSLLADATRAARLRFWIVIVGLLVIVGFVGSSGYDSWRSYRHVITATNRELGNLAKLPRDGDQRHLRVRRLDGPQPRSTLMARHVNIDNHQIGRRCGFSRCGRAYRIAFPPQPFHQEFSHECVFLDNDDTRHGSIRNVTVRCWWTCALIRSLRRCNFVSDSCARITDLA